ncbi:hypothetical protein BKA70DRAFT_1242067 [Coprinopsis sp. MPI-PUGE-AT-0042]|nr:hypothetical protein BKA70DRAFT_1242067 [Coprinopsis sp. MPI-PUGE-AT-0042]
MPPSAPPIPPMKRRRLSFTLGAHSRPLSKPSSVPKLGSSINPAALQDRRQPQDTKLQSDSGAMDVRRRESLPSGSDVADRGLGNTPLPDVIPFDKNAEPGPNPLIPVRQKRGLSFSMTAKTSDESERPSQHQRTSYARLKMCLTKDLEAIERAIWARRDEEKLHAELDGSNE